MRFRDFAKEIERFVVSKSKTTVFEILNVFNKVMKDNGFCFCDVMDILKDLENRKLIKLKDEVIIRLR